MKVLLDHYAEYDRWANTRFVERLATEGDAVLDRPVPSSFPTLRATLLHIRNAEATWTARLQNATCPWPAEEERAIASLLKYTMALQDLVHGYDPNDLAQTVTYHDLRGNAHAQPRWQMLLHCFNHSTQHRGQLISMMRALELDAIPANDLVVFQRSLPR
jgi:uncharacterized damage-inducible protein DinB